MKHAVWLSLPFFAAVWMLFGPVMAESGSTDSPVAEKTWKLKERGHIKSFAASPDGRYVVLSLYRIRADHRVESQAVLFDTTTGEATDIADLFGLNADFSTMGCGPRLSHDGKYLSVTSYQRKPKPYFARWIITLADRSKKEYSKADGWTFGEWVGDRLALSSLGFYGDTGQVMLANPVTGEIEKLKLYVLVEAGSPDGKTFVAMSVPDDPTRSIPLKMNNAGQTMMAAMTTDGKVLRKLGTGHEVDCPVYSSDGKYVAFLHRTLSEKGLSAPPKSQCVTVMSVRGDETREIKGTTVPIQVIDLQKVITLGDGTIKAKTSPVKLWDGDKSVTLVPNAQAAAVAEKTRTLYYVTGGPDEELVLHAAKIDDLKKSAGK